MVEKINIVVGIVICLGNINTIILTESLSEKNHIVVFNKNKEKTFNMQFAAFYLLKL